MTDQQILFAIEYVKLGNMTQAAINAGYSETSARNQGSRMMKNDEVARYVEQLQSEIAQENRVRMAAEASSAIAFLAKKMNDTEANDSDRIKCATELLNRSGYVAENKISIDTPDKVVITRKKKDAD